jgi:vitamin B12 transporter
LKSNQRIFLSLSILSASIFCVVSAQAEQAKTLDAIQVTGNRSDIKLEDSLASVTLITRADIEQSQAPDIFTLLAQQAGIDITRSGGAGALNSVFLRGSNSNHTLILMDGVRVNSSTQGSFDLSIMPVSMIDHIEIVRGPRAALWGSDAIGGVIQMFTRKAADFVEFRAGSYAHVSVDAGMAFGDSERNVGIQLGYGQENGFSATNMAAFGFNPDHDGFNNRHLKLNGKTTISEQKISGFVALTRADIEFDQGVTDQENTQAGLNLSGALTNRWQHNVSLNYHHERLDTPAFTSVFSTRRLGLDWVNTIALNDQNNLNVGLNWSQENGFSSDASSGGTQFDKDRRNAGIFATWRGNFTRNQFDVSMRHDDNNQFGANTSSQAAWGFKLSDTAKLRASWGQGFRAPNFNELYYPGFFGLFQGNPGLNPESSESFELGLNVRMHQAHLLDFSAYRTTIEDLIAFQGGATFSAVNIGRARLKGIEADYRFNLETFSLDINLGWQDARDLDSNTKLLRRADRKLNVTTDFRISTQFDWGLDFQAASRRPDFGAPAAGYGRLDARIRYHFAEAWTLEARLENLAGRDYELIPGFNTPGRSGLMTLRWNRPSPDRQ